MSSPLIHIVNQCLLFHSPDHGHARTSIEMQFQTFLTEPKIWIIYAYTSMSYKVTKKSWTKYCYQISKTFGRKYFLWGTLWKSIIHFLQRRPFCTYWVLVKVHDNNTYIIMEIPPDTWLDLPEVSILHLPFLCSPMKSSFNQPLCNALLLSTQVNTRHCL